MDSHIIADIDATGVNSEPMLEPITVANTAGMRFASETEESMPTKNMLMGRLFMRLLAPADSAPKDTRESALSKTDAIASVTPVFMSPSTTTNMESRNGTRCHGIRIAVFLSGCRDCLFASRQITAPSMTAPAEARHTIHISSPTYDEMTSSAVHTPMPTTPTMSAGLLRMLISSSLACRGSLRSLRKMRSNSEKETIAANTVGSAIFAT